MTPEDLEKLQAARKQREDRDLQAVLATPEGRRVLWRVIDEFGHLMRLSFDLDERNTSLHEGRRAVALSLYEECARVAPAHHVHMLNEALLRQQQDRLQAEAMTRDE